MTAWTDQFVGDRMAVDREFTERVAASEFSSQEWGTIMTAVEFHIENAESSADARVVADTSKVDQVLPAIEQMRGSMGGGGVGAGGATGGDASGGSGDEGNGLVGSIKRSLGFGGESEDEHRAEAAAALADEYAQQFQEHLESRGKWERAREVAAATSDASRGEYVEDHEKHEDDEDHQSAGEIDDGSANDE